MLTVDPADLGYAHLPHQGPGLLSNFHVKTYVIEQVFSNLASD